MADRVGQQLINYCVINLIGRGGFADVYLGEHIYLKSQNPANNLIAFMSDVPSSATFSLATLCRGSMLLFS